MESKATLTSCINWVFPHASELKIYRCLDASESYKSLEINSCLEVKKQQSNTSDVASNVCFPVDKGRTVGQNGIIFWKTAEWSLYYRVKPNSASPSKASLSLWCISTVVFNTEAAWRRKIPAMSLYNSSSACTGLLTPDSAAALCGRHFSSSKPLPLSALHCPVPSDFRILAVTEVALLGWDRERSWQALPWQVLFRTSWLRAGDSMPCPKGRRITGPCPGSLWGSPSQMFALKKKIFPKKGKWNRASL